MQKSERVEKAKSMRKVAGRIAQRPSPTYESQRGQAKGGEEKRKLEK